MTARWVIWVVLVAAWSPARAQAPDPDTQAARRHYDRGLALYDQERYDAAIREFSAAKELKPLPAFDFNIGRCYERLERWRDAAEAYERYLAAVPDAPERDMLKERLVVLHERANRQGSATAAAPPSSDARAATATATTATTRPQSPRPIYKRAWFWGVIAGGAVAVALGVGLGIGLSPHGDPSHAIMDVRF
ncbi:MAG TPA: tetratricopeptide repeat protein [Polyangia bacterium]|nr:tetratricopeptide repeat protein [Polyangia bacterium]